MIESSIQSVVRDGLCTGCGMCGGICPTGAIRMNTTSLPRPQLDESKCTGCGLCRKVCPGGGVRYAQLSQAGAGEHPGAFPEVGPLLEVRSGWARDAATRKAGASGGLATALARWMLQTGRIDAAVTVAGRQDKPFGVRAFLARNEEQLRAGQQSKYNMAPMDSVLAQMLSRPGRYLVVALPCQIAGLRMAMQCRPVLRKRIIALVGLLCGYAMDPGAAEQMCRKCHVRPRDVEGFLGWRALDYPGSFAFRTRDGKVHRIELPEWLDAGTARFSQLRCHLCPDGFARGADLSLGDRSSVTPDLNETLTLVRTPAGRDLLDQAQAQGAIRTQVLPTDEALSESTCAFMKRIKVRMPLALLRSLAGRNMPLPVYDLDCVVNSRQDRLMARSYWSLCRLARSRWVKPLVNAHPSINQALGRMIYRRYHQPHWRLLAWLGIL